MTNYELEMAKAQAAIEAANKATASSPEKMAQALIQGMQVTQKNIMQTFTDFQVAFKKLSEDMVGMK